MLIKNSKNSDIVVVKENDSTEITTPSAPRARNTSDVGIDAATSASEEVASFASIASFASLGYNYGMAVASSPFQASPAMILADGAYMMNMMDGRSNPAYTWDSGYGASNTQMSK